MMPDDYNYMKALWNHFYGHTPTDPVSDELHHHLSGQLDTDQRKLLLKLIDCQTQHTEMVSLDSFVTGFRVAIGIAKEISDDWFDYRKEEENRIGK